MGRLASHIAETSTGTGTGNLTLAGAETNRKSFNSEYGLNKRFPYQIEHTDTDWEEGVGYLSASTTLVRETVLRSSNSDAAVNFTAGEKSIAVDFVSQMQFGYVTKAATITTSDLSALSGNNYELTISGLTAERDFILPVPSAVGEQIRVKLVTDASADYELVIKGAATVTINNGTAATEWSRLLIKDEVVEFRATSTTNWDVVNDDRILANGRMHRNTSQSIPGSTQAIIECNVLDKSIGVTCDVITNHKITIRRGGLYQVNVMGSLASMADQKFAMCGLRVNTDINPNSWPSNYAYSSAPNSGLSFLNTFLKNFSVGDYVRLNIYHSGPSALNTRDTDGYTYPYIEITEVL